MDKMTDAKHAFPRSVDGYANEFGQVTPRIGSDGNVYQWLEIPGSYGSKTGVF